MYRHALKVSGPIPSIIAALCAANPNPYNPAAHSNCKSAMITLASIPMCKKLAICALIEQFNYPDLKTILFLFCTEIWRTLFSWPYYRFLFILPTLPSSKSTDFYRRENVESSFEDKKATTFTVRECEKAESNYVARLFPF